MRLRLDMKRVNSQSLGDKTLQGFHKISANTKYKRILYRGLNITK